MGGLNCRRMGVMYTRARPQAVARPDQKEICSHFELRREVEDVAGGELYDSRN